MSFVYKTRVLLIEIGKSLPFLICAIILVSYTENIYALYNENYMYINDVVVLDKPISHFIGQYFEYGIVHLFVVFVISIAILTCVWNKLACLYLGLNLVQKSWFECHEYDNEVYYIVSALNIIICTYLCWKGIVILTKSKRHD